MIDELIETLSAHDPPDECEAPPASLLGFFTHLADHADLYRDLLGPGGSARVIDHILGRTAAAVHRGKYPDRDAPPAGTGSSTEVPHDVSVDWLHRGCPRTPTEMAVLTLPLIAPLSGQRGARRDDSEPART